jgi:LPXTG-motif cell wall-anchored protein
MTHERRAARRLPVPESQSAAMIRLGRQQIAGKLVNRSAKGLGIECPATFTPAVGDRLALRLASGWIEARVVHVQVAPERVLVGLEWQRDLPETGAAGAHHLLLVGLLAALASGVAAGMYLFAD